MQIVNIAILLIVIVSFTFILFQIWYLYENKEYIYDYVDKYSNFKYIANPSISFIDKTVYDINENITDEEKKMRCVMYYQEHWNDSDTIDQVYIAVQENGFISTNSSTADLIFNNYYECIKYIFSNSIFIIYDPCNGTNPVTNDCNFLKLLLTHSYSTV